MASYRITYSQLAGTVRVPPSKSQTLRAILLASLAEGVSDIHNYLVSPDTNAMLQACKALGATVQHQTDKTVAIQGVGGLPRCPDRVIDAGNSGLVLRFISAVAGLTTGYTVITGDRSIRYNRPMAALLKGLSELGGFAVSTKNDGCAPIIIRGPIAAGRTCVEGADSQPVSSLLIAAAFLKGTTTIDVVNPGETPWVELTLDWFDRLRVAYTRANDFTQYTVTGCHQAIRGFEYTVPGDFSSLAYPVAAALVTQSAITITHLDWQDKQGDKKLLSVLRAMGARFTIKETALVVAPSGQLVGKDIDVNDMIDALPILAVLGCYAKGTTRLYNAAIARQKESDRLAAITQELSKMGACIDEAADALTIQGVALKSAQMTSHNDHRIALSLAVAAMGVKGESSIDGVDCVAKTYPHFLSAMQSLGAAIKGVSVKKEKGMAV